METSPAFVIMMMTLPALVGSLVVSLNSKKTNAAWRARREAHAVARASAK